MTRDEPDWIAIRSGIIPWHPDGYVECSDEHRRLLATPHDDWERGRLPFRLGPVAAEELRLPGILDCDQVESQIVRFLARRYAGAPCTIVLSHVRRYFMILDFLVDNRDRLESDGLIVPPRRHADEWYSTALIRVLAVVRYEARSPGRADPQVRCFNYTRVSRAARRLLADPGGDPL